MPTKAGTLVDDASKTINMTIENTTFPNQFGIQQKRIIDLITADELKYSNPTATVGGKKYQAFKQPSKADFCF